MSTKRAATSGQGRSSKTTTSTSSQKRPERSAKSRVLSADEEKVVRMRRGISAPDDLTLERVGQSHPSTRAKLLELEKRAFERSGRLDELRRDVGLPATRTDAAKKEKIIAGLAAKKKTPAKSKAAPVKKTKRK